MSVNRIVGLGWVGLEWGESAIAGGLRPRWWWSFFSCLRRAVVGLVEQQTGSSSRGGGGGQKRTTGTARHSAGGRCTVQNGPVRFSNSNSIAAIKEQPGQSRRGKAGTICWWRRRESWEWIGPTATAETQWPGGCCCCLLGVGAATGRVIILLSFTCILLLSQYWEHWTLLAGGQRFGSSASRPARTVRQPASDPENGRPLLLSAACRPGKKVPGPPPHLLPKDKYLAQHGGGGI